jgi:hypothetical protein
VLLPASNLIEHIALRKDVWCSVAILLVDPAFSIWKVLPRGSRRLNLLPTLDEELLDTRFSELSNDAVALMSR